jgi:hypothetical protein
MTADVHWPARRAERFGLVSIFGSTFCIKAKGGITTTSMNVRKQKRFLQQCFARLSMTKQEGQTK